VAYIFVPSKESLGAASSTKRPTSCVLIIENSEASYAELYKEVLQKVESVAPIF
jgi:H/ACA ribonucleoprotein complex subunit 2